MAERENPEALEVTIFGPVGMIALGMGHAAMAVLLQDILGHINAIFTTLKEDHPEAFEAVRGKQDAIASWLKDFVDIIRMVCACGGLERICVGHTFERLNINTVLYEALVAVGECMPLGHVNITGRYASPLPDVLGNEGLLKLAFMHLIKNAIEALDEGGVVTLETSLFYENSIRVKISDNGCGVPKKIRPTKLFQLGCTTKVGHSGVGLPVVALVIHAHDGTVAFDTRNGKGTTFSVILPDI